MNAFAARLSVLEARQADQRHDVDDQEKRLRRLEEERASIRLATRELRNVRRELPELAENAAARAVALYHQARAERRRELLTSRATVVGTVATIAGAVVGAIALFH